MRRSRQLLYQTETLKTELLNTPINQLGLSFKGTIFEQAIPQVLDEVKASGISRLQPVFYLSTGYGCIAGSPIISLGFYDCHPLLKDLNEEIRGWRYSDAEIFDLLRHEIGHAFCYSYKLYRSADFRSLFEVEGNFFATYPEGDDYWYNPWSRRYVNPNGDHYAQKHPDEDFAETFCVWLTPRSGWRKNYKARPTALKKLRYADRVVKDLGNEPPLVPTNLHWQYERVEDLRLTVAEFMRAKVKPYVDRSTGYVDPDLRALFRAEPRLASRRAVFKDFMRADQFLREQKQTVVNRVAYWVGVDNAVVVDLIEKCLSRVRALNLWLERAQYDKKVVEAVAYITALCMNYKHTGSYLRVPAV